MKKKSKILILSSSLIALAIAGYFVYDYGTLVVAEGYAITQSGTKIAIPSEWIHIAWTPSYIIARQFHVAIDTIASTSWLMVNFVGTSVGMVEKMMLLAGIIYAIYRFLFKKKPYDGLNGGPYKIS